MKIITLTDKVIVSDPCYPLNEQFGPVLLDNVLEGEYHTFVEHTKPGAWEGRISRLFAVHSNHYKNYKHLSWWKQDQTIGVDSGQAGIFTLDSYRNDKVFTGKQNNFNKDESWYGHICDRTLSKEQWGTYENGVVSSSGFGDGEYELWLAKEDEKVIAIAINFFYWYNLCDS
jgi:hypothetical protein